MTYSETLDYMYHKLPMFTRVGAAAYKKDLTNTLALCSHLGNPHHKFKSIHVGGTNGKGSTSHMLASILQTAGYKTGLYTSPHLYDFRERIKINGQMIPKDNVVAFIKHIQPLIESTEPSFFEITVAMAFDYFAAQNVDVALVEVGLGGRLDSTNIINPELSVITNISLDHTAMLGNTVQEIAAEKAGIIKAGIPVVIGEKDLLTDSVFLNKAAAVSANIFFASEAYETIQHHWEEEFLSVLVQDKIRSTKHKYRLDLPGIYQTKNICTVLKATDTLRQSGLHIPAIAVEQGAMHVKKNTSLLGRWEQLQKSPRIFVDVAHNEAGIKQLMLQLQNIQFNKLHIVLGMVKDKAIAAVLELLPKNATYYFTQARIPRALPGAALQQQAADFLLTGLVYENVNKALDMASGNAETDDLILVCGSIFLIGEIDKTRYQ